MKFSGPNASYFEYMYKRVRNLLRKGWSFEKIAKEWDIRVVDVQIYGGFEHRSDPMKPFETQYRNGARSRDKEYSLTSVEFVSLVLQPCFYCGALPRTRQVGNKSFEANGVDRVDNALGYVEGNVVPCCTVCNLMKMTKDAVEFVEHCKRIADRARAKERPTKSVKKATKSSVKKVLKRAVPAQPIKLSSFKEAMRQADIALGRPIVSAAFMTPYVSTPPATQPVQPKKSK